MKTSSINLSVRLRLKLIDALLAHYGYAGRVVVMDFFGIGEAQATRDFALYRKLAPGNAEYDSATKSYLRSRSFEPLDPLPYAQTRMVSGSNQGAAACRVCGCTDDDCRGCVERTGEACYWAESDLCSACVGAPGDGEFNVEPAKEWEVPSLEFDEHGMPSKQLLEGIRSWPIHNYKEACDFAEFAKRVWEERRWGSVDIEYSFYRRRRVTFEMRRLKERDRRAPRRFIRALREHPVFGGYWAGAPLDDAVRVFLIGESEPASESVDSVDAVD